MIRIPTHRQPTHPGEMLLEEFLIPLGLTQRDLANAIHVPYQRVNEIVNGRRGITPSTSLRLAKYFSTTQDFWLNLQLRWDLYHAQKNEKHDLRIIKALSMKSSSSSGDEEQRDALSRSDFKHLQRGKDYEKLRAEKA